MKMIRSFLNRIEQMLENDAVQGDFKNLFFVSFLESAICIGLVFAFSINRVNSSIFLVAIFLLMFFATALYMLARFREVTFFKYFIVIIVRFFLYPTLFYLGGDIYGGTGLFLFLGLISVFFLFEGEGVFVASAVLMAWYGIILYMPYKYYDRFAVYRHGSGADRYSQVFAFLFVSFVPILVILYQSHVQEKTGKTLEYSRKIKHEAQNNKSRFLANVTNEIRTPMNSIVSMNELLLREDLDAESRELVENIRNSSNQLLRIINNVLEFSKLESDKMELQQQKYEFGNMMEEIIKSVSVEYASEDNEFYVSIDPNIPSVLFGDYIRIKQVFLYILFSTINKMPHNRISLKVTGDVNPETNTVLMTCVIAEAGLGLSSSEIEAMLSAYTNYDSRQKSEYKGMGLELSICKEILERMGGSISIESVEGIGMSVKFDFINYIIDDAPAVRVSSSNDYSILVYGKNDLEREIWNDLLAPFQLYAGFVSGPNAFRMAIENRKYTHVFIDDIYYSIIKDTLRESGIEESVYIVTEASGVYSDYGKCKILRKPLSCLNVATVLNDNWKEDAYRISGKKDKVIYPTAKILLVDDSAVNLKVLDGMLKSFEVSTKTCRSGKEALKILETEAFDMLIIDQLMPEMDGIELLSLIKRMDNINSNVPILCATADFGPDVARKLINEGFQDYLAKPVRKHYLERMLREYLPIELAVNISVDYEEKTEQKSERGQEQPQNTGLGAVEENTEKPDVIYYEEGINGVGGSQEVYNEVVLSYYKEGLTKLESVPQMFAEDLSNYVIEVHALKSSSAAIGAKGLSAMFKALEFAGRAQNREYIEAHSDSAFKALDDVLNILKEYLENNGVSVQEDDYEQMSGEVMKLQPETVEEIISALAKFNLKLCEDKIKELAQINYGKDINAKIKSIKDSYEMFDYHKVKDELAILKDYLL